jgi:hypothetical protein
MQRLLCTLALSFIASPVFADPPPGGMNASSGALGRELIARANADGVFELAASEAQTIVIRHIRSGLTCRLNAAGANRLVIFPQAARGEDVACETSANGETVALFASRFSFATSLDQQMAGVEAAIRRHYPDAAPYAATIEIPSDTLPAHRTAAFIVTRDGARTFTSASVAQVGAWVIKLRYTARAPDDTAARAGERAAGQAFAAALADLVDARAPAP